MFICTNLSLEPRVHGRGVSGKKIFDSLPIGPQNTRLHLRAELTEKLPDIGVDTHRRELGTLRVEKPLVVRDTIANT